MAQKTLRGINFPGLNDIYMVPEVDNTLSKPGASADAKVVGDALAMKLDSASLYDTINSALAQAKESGKFDGPKGDPGENGDDGKTPVKGIDYFTEVDKVEMINAVIAALPIYDGEVVEI